MPTPTQTVIETKPARDVVVGDVLVDGNGCDWRVGSVQVVPVMDESPKVHLVCRSDGKDLPLAFDSDTIVQYRRPLSTLDDIANDVEHDLDDGTLDPDRVRDVLRDELACQVREAACVVGITFDEAVERIVSATLVDDRAVERRREWHAQARAEEDC